MGNLCKNQLQQGELLPQLSKLDFLSSSWQLLKQHNQLSFLTSQSQQQLYNQLLSLSTSTQINTIAITPQTHTYAVYKSSCYLYVGQVVKDIIRGKGALALPKQKIFIGQFVNNKIQGKGEITLKAARNQQPTNLKITANWDKTILGTLQVDNSPHKLVFQLDRNKIKVGCNPKYIQYPNFDQYLGQTQNGMAHGQGKYVFRNGDPTKDYPVYQGTFEKGYRQGKGILKYSQSMELQIIWVRGKPDGTGILTINKNRNNIWYQHGKRVERKSSECDAD